MKKISILLKNPFFIVTALIIAILIFYNVIDLIYGADLFIHEKYTTLVGPFTASQARRSEILTLGTYTGINFHSFIEMIRQMFISLDYEIPLIIFLIGLNYYFAYTIGDTFSFNRMVNRVISFYLSVYFLTLAADFLALLNNIIPFNNVEYYASILGLISIISSMIKLALIAFIILYFIKIFKSYIFIKIPAENQD